MQLWNLPWWHCSSGSCVDEGINEIEYIEKVITTLKSKFNIDTNKVSRYTHSRLAASTVSSSSQHTADTAGTADKGPIPSWRLAPAAVVLCHIHAVGKTI